MFVKATNFSVSCLWHLYVTVNTMMHTVLEVDELNDIGMQDCPAADKHTTEYATQTEWQTEEADDRAPSVSSIASDTCSVLFELFDVQFPDAEDARRMCEFSSIVVFFVCIWLVSSSVSFFSSGHVQYASQIDVLVSSSDIAAVDVISALEVVCGFVAAYVHKSMHDRDFKYLARMVWLLLMIDVWLATILSLVFGSIFHLLNSTFRARDVVITTLEGLSGLRVLEWHQDGAAWHTYNMAGWPVMCLAWSFLLIPYTVAVNNWLYKRFASVGYILVLLNACLPIVVITTFALLREDTNIFFANASSMGYRLLEFNLGVCLFHFMHAQSDLVTRMFFVLKQVSGLVALSFLLLWLAQIGSDAPPTKDKCVRMYYFARCIQTHHTQLMRGCVLGMTGIACVVVRSSVGLPASSLSIVPVLSSAVVFCWPVCYVLMLLMQINASKDLMRDNTSLLVFIMPLATFCVSYLWNMTMKMRCFHVVEQYLLLLSARMPAFSNTS